MELQRCTQALDRRWLFALLVICIIVNTIVVVQYKDSLLMPSLTNKFTFFFQQDDSRTAGPLLDVHFSDENGHSGKVSGPTHFQRPGIQTDTIAIGGGITSAKIKPNATKEEIRKKSPLFSVMLPSFCSTCGTKYSFHFYFAYDYKDPLFSSPSQLAVVSEIFHEQVGAKCPKDSVIKLHMVQCNHTKKPAWAQNDAMMEAYIDNMEYFYRINDDSKLQKPGWAGIFVERLKQFHPPNVGVVGPKHKGGNVGILTYDFTHHTHQDMFGFHYPRDFPDWYADNWITNVYKPGRVEKMKDVPLVHTMQLGQRYKHHITGGKLPARYAKDKPMIQRYVKYLEASGNVIRDPSKVIAISLSEPHPRITYGALRNVQQAPVFFPEWTVRIYVLSANVTENPVPERLLNKMETLGAEIYVLEKLHYPKESVAYHVIQDDSVQTVLFRDPEFRLSDRQKAAVDEWMSSSAIMHCMKDHQTHALLPLVPGLLGIKLDMLRKSINMAQTLRDILAGLTKTNSHESFGKRLWQEFEKVFMCHDSVIRDKHQNSRPFPVGLAPNDTLYFEGQKYNEHMDPVIIT